MGEFLGGRLFVFPLTSVTFRHLREALPELAPEVPGKRNTVGLLEVSPSFLPEIFRTLWKKDLMPSVFTSGEEALESGTLSAFWGAFAGGKGGPFGAMFLGKDTVLLAQALRLGYTVLLFEAQSHIRLEVFSWDEKRLVDAFFSLSPWEKEIWKRYAGRTIKFSKDCVLAFPEAECLKIVLAYAPLLDTLEESFATLVAYHAPFAFGASLGKVTKEVHFFLAEELHRRGVDFAFLLFEKEAQEHLLLAQAIQGYRPGIFSTNLLSSQEGYIVILKYPGFSALCDILAARDPQLSRHVLRTPFSPSSRYEEHRETFETLLFQFFEDFVQRIEERFGES